MNGDPTHTGYQLKWIRLSLFNLLVLSFAGLLLRAFPLLPIPYLSYMHVLHAHSHFAFGGWVLPALAFLVLKYFPEISAEVQNSHWRNLMVLIIISSYGMLTSFSLLGYGAVSIAFSMLSLFTGYYFGIQVFRHARRQQPSVPLLFLQAGIIFCFISSLGPFTLGPLSAMGKTGSQLYINVIYFYLHFQYNGFFTFLVLAALYKMMEKGSKTGRAKTVYYLMTIACVPAYFLSVLWTPPSLLFNYLGGLAALVQLIAVGLILYDLRNTERQRFEGRIFLGVSFIAFVLKNVLQLLSAFPKLARMASLNRNYVIAYLHLVLLGFISTFLISCMVEKPLSRRIPAYRTGSILFLSAFFITEVMLVSPVPPNPAILFGMSLLFPAGLAFIWRSACIKDPSCGKAVKQPKGELLSTAASLQK